MPMIAITTSSSTRVKPIGRSWDRLVICRAMVPPPAHVHSKKSDDAKDYKGIRAITRPFQLFMILNYVYNHSIGRLQRLILQKAKSEENAFNSGDFRTWPGRCHDRESRLRPAPL